MSCHWPWACWAEVEKVPATCWPSTVTVNWGSPFQLSAATRNVSVLVAAVGCAGVVTTGAAATDGVAAEGRPVVLNVTVPLLSTVATPPLMLPPEFVAPAADSVVPPRVRLWT